MKPLDPEEKHLTGFRSDDSPPLHHEMDRDEIAYLADEFEAISSTLAEEFLKTIPRLQLLSRNDLLHWIAYGKHVTSYGNTELAIAFFQSSPALISSGTPPSLLSWAKQGIDISNHSPGMATAFFNATPAFLEKGDIMHLKKWAQLALKIRTAISGNDVPATAFIRSSVRLMEFITFSELKEWSTVGLTLGKYSPAYASQYFSLTPELLGDLYRTERVSLFQLVSLFAEVLPERSIDFYEQALTVLTRLNPNIREPLLSFTCDLAKGAPEKIDTIFETITTSMFTLSNPEQSSVMKEGLRIWNTSPEACLSYFNAVPRLLIEIDETFLHTWVERGLSILHHNIRKGIRYFALETADSWSETIKLKHAVSLEDVRHVLTLFARALTGKNMQVQNSEESETTAQFYPAGDGLTIFLPPFSADEMSSSKNFRTYKVATAHQAGYVEFGSLQGGLHLILKLLDTLPLKRLARDIFFILEDGRIDSLLKQAYRGLKNDIEAAVADSLARRPAPAELPQREGLVECLLRLTVEQLPDKDVPPQLLEYLSFLRGRISTFYHSAKSVWDSFFAAREIYDFFIQIGIASEWGSTPDVSEENLDHPYSSSLPIPFRGMFDPELLTDPITLNPPSYEEGEDEKGTPLSLDELKRILENIENYNFIISKGDEVTGQGLFVSDLEGLPVSDSEESDDTYERFDCPVVLPGKAINEGPFHYDEWDYQQKSYRRKWCCLREKDVKSANTALIDLIRDTYDDLIQNVRRQFQRIRPSVLDPLRRVEWGDEIDYTALIQSITDRKAGQSPSDRIFARKEKRIRRIGTLMLIDMSASTNDRVPVAAHRAQSTVNGDAEHQEKRIIDIERESLVVITEALHALGDQYAIFGFSGYGRKSVDFYRIKDFTDSHSEARYRIGGMQPQQSTRMGTAIRHAIGKLKSVDADQHLLVLLSDGFPQDCDYGEDRRSNEYGLHDTMMALFEAKREGIAPFCITFDQSGNDYLRKMIDPTSYLILRDVYRLPEILPRVIESLL
jgi:nitric oxide reductase NorD protein